MASSFAEPLDDELASVASERVHARPSVVGERYAALRWHLDRANEIHCDGYATAETPGYDAGTPVETKAVRVEHHDGVGRLNVHVDSHEQLREADGAYAVVVYVDVEHEGEQRILVLAAGLVDAVDVDPFVERGRCLYQKVAWPKLLENADVDLARWSA